MCPEGAERAAADLGDWRLLVDDGLLQPSEKFGKRGAICQVGLAHSAQLSLVLARLWHADRRGMQHRIVAGSLAQPIVEGLRVE